jgi:hypothetical protein
MRLGLVTRNLLIVAGCFCLVAYSAGREGYAHDQSGLCVIDLSMPPPFLGFEYWSQVGIALAVVATGMVIAVVILWRNNS